MKSKVEDAVGYFSRTAEEFDARYQNQPGFQEGVAVWHDLLERYAPPDGLAIDMGCGSGLFTFYLARMGGRVVGVDGAPDMVALCEGRRRELGVANIQFLQARLPCVEERDLRDADLVISSSVIEYIDNLDATLRLFARLLKPHGTLIVSMPNLASISRLQQRLRYRLTRTPEIYEHIRHFSSPRLLERRVRRLGLTLLEARYYTHFTRISMLCRRLGLPPMLTEDLFVAVFRKH